MNDWFNDYTTNATCFLGNFKFVDIGFYDSSTDELVIKTEKEINVQKIQVKGKKSEFNNYLRVGLTFEKRSTQSGLTDRLSNLKFL